MSNRQILPPVALALLLCCCDVVPSTISAAEAKTSAVAPCCNTVAACGKRPGDQVWVVCTRHLGCLPVTAELPHYHVQYFAQNAWHASNTPALLAEDEPGMPTVVFVHGNRYSTSDAIESGWEAYHALTRCAPAGQPIRFVIWSWPSEKDGGPIRDARIKASRTLTEGYYLSRLITRIQPEVPTSLIGYSFGSRVALGAVHLAAGGQLAGRVVPDLPQGQVAMYRVAMLAAGVEDDGLMPGARFQMAMQRTDYLLNLYNPIDPILKRYRVVSKYEKPTAMGYTGIVGEGFLGETALRICERNVSGIVGKTHNEDGYFQSEYLMRQVRSTVLVGPIVVPAKVAKK